MVGRHFAGKTMFVFVLALAAAAAYGQTYTVESGKTTVTLSSDFVSALGTLHVTPGVIGPTALSSGKANFPVVAGALDVNNAKGEVLHSGGLTLATSSTRVRLQSYIIDTTGSSPVISGIVTANGKIVGRMTLFDLQLPSGLKLPLKPSGDTLTLTGVGVTLDAGAANALNTVFSVSGFQGGLKIGTATVTAIVNADTGR